MVARVVVGAHYGAIDWLAQRISAVLIALYSVMMLGVISMYAPFSHGTWLALFTSSPVRIATLLCSVVLAWHVWVGVRNILMDYVKPVSLRLALQVGCVMTIALCISWTIRILWR